MVNLGLSLGLRLNLALARVVDLDLNLMLHLGVGMPRLCVHLVLVLHLVYDLCMRLHPLHLLLVGVRRVLHGSRRGLRCDLLVLLLLVELAGWWRLRLRRRVLLRRRAHLQLLQLHLTEGGLSVWVLPGRQLDRGGRRRHELADALRHTGGHGTGLLMQGLLLL